MDRESRQILGYHVVAGSAAALHYSSDEQSGPLSKLALVYDDIRTGSFLPDATRLVTDSVLGKEFLGLSWKLHQLLLRFTWNRSPSVGQRVRDWRSKIP